MTTDIKFNGASPERLVELSRIYICTPEEIIRRRRIWVLENLALQHPKASLDDLQHMVDLALARGATFLKAPVIVQ